MVEAEKPAEEPDMIQRAYDAADKLEKANQKSEELAKRLEALESRKILGGQSQASPPEQPPKEETPQEYAKRMLRGG